MTLVIRQRAAVLELLAHRQDEDEALLPAAMGWEALLVLDLDHDVSESSSKCSVRLPAEGGARQPPPLLARQGVWRPRRAACNCTGSLYQGAVFMPCH